jgi:hypothetical protein
MGKHKHTSTGRSPSSFGRGTASPTSFLPPNATSMDLFVFSMSRSGHEIVGSWNFVDGISHMRHPFGPALPIFTSARHLFSLMWFVMMEREEHTPQGNHESSLPELWYSE